MGKSNDKPQTTVQQAQIPYWLQNQYQENYARARQTANAPFQANPYASGPGANGMLQQAWGMVGNQGAAWKPLLGQGTDALTRAAGQTWQQITPQTFLNGLSNIQSYMNPYTGLVEDAAKNNMALAYGQNLNQIGDKAAGMGAYGSSRQGVAEGAAASEYARQFGDLSAQLRNQNWQQATQMLGADITNDLSAQAQNQSSKMDYMKALAATGLGLGQLAQTGYGMDAADANALANAGMQQYQIEAAQNAGQSADFLRQQDWKLRGLNAMIAATSGVAAPQTQTTTAYGGGSSSPLLGGLGGALAGSQLANATGWFGSGTGALLGGLLGIFSDKNSKTDIEKLGKDPETGLDMYAYRYKGDPKSYPKVVGPMAQDIAKAFPGMTRRIGGKMVVNGLAGGLA